jgi:hypothetical protein
MTPTHRPAPAERTHGTAPEVSTSGVQRGATPCVSAGALDPLHQLTAIHDGGPSSGPSMTGRQPVRSGDTPPRRPAVTHRLPDLWSGAARPPEGVPLWRLTSRSLGLCRKHHYSSGDCSVTWREKATPACTEASSTRIVVVRLGCIGRRLGVGGLYVRAGKHACCTVRTVG